MPRILRTSLPDGSFHVTARGVNGSAIFLDDHDRLAFLRLLAKAVRRYGWTVRAYCLMGNHYHLILETTQPRLSRGMQYLNGSYAQRFNLRHGRTRHLFGARFAAWVIESEGHLRHAIEYLLANPVRAGICARIGDWPWSAARVLTGAAKLRDDRRQDLLQVADHCEVGPGDDRSMWILVDREDPLRALAADHVLDCPADAAGDVEVGRDPRAGLADLVGVRTPAEVGHDARAADGAPEHVGQLLERREALGAPHAAAAADDVARVAELDLPGGRLVAACDADPEVSVDELRRELVHHGRDPTRRLGGDDMRRDGQQLRRPVEPRLLEEAAAPALPRDEVRIPLLHGDAVRRQRHAEPSRGVRQHLVAAIAPRSEHGLRLRTLDQGDHARRPRLRRVVVETLVDGKVHALGAELRGERTRLLADKRRLDGAAERTRERHRLERELVQRTAVVLGDDEDHGATPSSRNSSATRGAASGPLPRICTGVPSSCGTISRTFSRPGSGRAGSSRSSSCFLARSRPGSDGYRGRLIPSLTLRTAGSGSSNISQPPEASRRTVSVPSAMSIPFTPVTHGRSSAAATRTATW